MRRGLSWRLSLLVVASDALTLPPISPPHVRGAARVERVRAYWRRDAQSPLARRLERIIAEAMCAAEAHVAVELGPSPCNHYGPTWRSTCVHQSP